MSLSQAKLFGDVGSKVASITLGSMKEQGAELQKLFQSAVVVSDPLLGGHIDISA